MATLQELERALIGADKAGDVDAARALAQAIKQARLQAPQAADAPQAEDPGFGQSILIGTGRAADRIFKGVKQTGLNVVAPFSDAARGELDRMSAEEADNSRHYEKLRGVRPGATMLGEALPLVAAPIMGAGMAATAASAALPGLIEYGTGEERLARGAMGAAGGAVGRAAGNAIARVIKPTATISGAQQGANAAADRLGVKLTAGEASGNRALRWAEGASADMPLASGIASKRIAGNEKAISQAATRALGAQADEVSEAALAAARDRISGEYERILTPLKIDLSNKSTMAELNAVTGSKVLKSLRDEGVDSLLTEIKQVAASGPVDGAWFQQNKTALDMAIRSAYNSGKSGAAKSLEMVEKTLDRAARKAMGADESAAYDAARKQWANLRMLETGKVVEGGKVMPGRLRSAMEARYKAAMKEGKIKGELADIASLADVIRPMPQSGTAPRAIYSGMMGGAAMMEPITAAGMLAAPATLQAISPAMRRYMTKGLLDLTPEAEARLLSLGGRAGLLGTYGATQ